MASEVRHAATQRQVIARRRHRVATLYHAGQTQEEIADTLDVSQSVVSRDLAAVRAWWKEQATEDYGDWVDRELAFALEQRASTLAQWHAAHSSRMMSVVVRWSERIARLLGLDAPDKIEDWTEKDWKAYARANGIDEADVIAEAEAIIAEAKRGPAIAAPGD